MALGFKFFSSSDPGAPALSALAGSLVAVLDWALDTSDAVNGWEIVYTATNKRVYRSRYGIRDYLRVDDTNAGYAFARAYYNMTDIDTGTDPYPNTTQAPAANARWAKTFQAAGSAAYPYYGIKTARSILLFRPARRSGTLTDGDLIFFGEVPRNASLGSDAHLSLISIHNTASNPSASGTGPFNSSTAMVASGPIGFPAGFGSTPGAATSNWFFRANRAGTLISAPARGTVPPNNASNTNVNTAPAGDEPIALSPIELGSPVSTATGIIQHVRGYVPGLYWMNAYLDGSWSHGDTFQDSEGLTYVYMEALAQAASSGVVLALGLTDDHGAL